MTDPEKNSKWSEAAHKALNEGFASGNMMDAEIPEYGKLGDLNESQLREIADRHELAVKYQRYKIKGH